MVKLNFTPFPNLTTERCELRKLSLEDDQEIFITRSDKEILRYLDVPKAQSIEDARKFINKINTGIENNEWIYWAISLKDDPKCIGTICLWNFSIERSAADIGFVLLNEYQGKGIMREVVPVILDYGFNALSLQTIDGEVAPGNRKSINLMKKFGFTFTEDIGDTHIYSLKNE